MSVRQYTTAVNCQYLKKLISSKWCGLRTAVQIVPQKSALITQLKSQVLFECILSNVKKYYGDYGLGIIEQGFKVKYCNKNSRIAIIRCLHASYQYVTSILPLIVLIGDIRSKISIIYVGATVIQCNKFIIKYHRNYFNRMLVQAISAEHKELAEYFMEFD